VKAPTSNVIAFVDLPPPAQGISIVSSWVVQFLKDQPLKLEVVNTLTSQGRLYALNRLSMFLVSFVKVLSAPPNSTIYIALSHGQALYLQMVIIFLAKLKKLRVLAHHHTYLPITQPRKPINLICHTFIKNKVEHIFLSDKMQEQYFRVWSPSKKLWVVTNHQVAFKRTNGNVKTRKFPGRNMTYSGRMSSEKGFWDAAAVSRKILSHNKHMSVTFLGPIMELPISKEILNLKDEFGDRFEHISIYDEDVLQSKLYASSYFLFPSRYINEASPLVVLEAQALGNICITSDIGSLSHDVLSPGCAVKIDSWNSSVIDTVAMFRNKNLDLIKYSKQIQLEMFLRAELSSKQIAEVFYL
jgi:glycosyltransferase involved in cell wall biosynthesis